MIFYFTATGNCLYAARELAAEGEDVISIPQEMRREGELTYADDAIGIVYPIYGHMMPAMVRAFVERATLDTPYLRLTRRTCTSCAPMGTATPTRRSSARRPPARRARTRRT